MPSYQTPGVYTERADADGGGVNALSTDVAGFVGIAERGPLHLAVPVESFRQFQAWFGEPIANGYLACCARAFFDNGGRRLWCVRVASEAAAPATLTLLDDAVPPAPLWRVEAASAGSWGNALAVRARVLRRGQVRATLDPAAPATLRVPAGSAHAAWDLIDLQQAGAAPRRAIVRSADMATGTLTLDRAPAGFALAEPLRVETLTWIVEVWRAGRLVAVHDELSLVPEHPRYGPAVLKQPWQAVAPDAPDDEPAGPASEAALRHFRVGRNRAAQVPPAVVIRELRDTPARAALRLPVLPPEATPLPLTGGVDGLADLAELDFTGAPGSPFDSDLVQARDRRGIAALDPVDEIGVVAVPDIQIQPRLPALHEPPRCVPAPCLPGAPATPVPAPVPVPDLPPRFDAETIARVQAAQVEHAERHRDRVALLDAPLGTCTAVAGAITTLAAWRQRFDSAFAALYAPWPLVVDPIGAGAAAGPRGALRAIPPCGHVAGLIAATDLRRGVHVAPANAPLQWLQRLSMAIDDARHGQLNAMGVNVLRADPGRGLRVLGARTLSADPDWRFLNVRRLMAMIEKTLATAIQWAVFEPNDWRTRSKLALSIGSFLQALHERGAFAGTTPSESYFVVCSEANNPPAMRALGELHVDIGVAPAVPFEFIVLRIGRDANGFAIGDDAAALPTAA